MITEFIVAERKAGFQWLVFSTDHSGEIKISCNLYVRNTNYDQATIADLTTATTATTATPTTVLVMNSRNGWKPIVLIDETGRHDEVSCFTTEQNTEAYGSCSISFQNDFFIFGGKNQVRQISKLSGYTLTLVGSLSFDHYFGACNVIGDKIYLQKFFSEKP